MTWPKSGEPVTINCNMLNFVDNFLNRTTMYRLMLYYLGGLIVVAGFFGAVGILPYNPLWLLFSVCLIIAICWFTNAIFANIFRVPSNEESVVITALILVLIISPMKNSQDLSFFSLAIWASILAIASKYILAIGKKHIFNPAAFAVAITALAINQTASWWVGTIMMSPFVIIGGLLVAKKILRFDLVFSFILVALAGVIASHLTNQGSLFMVIEKTLLSSSALFLAFVMLTEPYTTPPTAYLRICYGALVGFLFVPVLHFGKVYSTPELALLVGNIFVYLVSPKIKLILTLKEKVPIATDAYDFVFTTKQKLCFKAGQYLEWTFKHPYPDNRGIRRYFTIASSPTEKEIKMGVKFYQPASTFKKQLLNMPLGDTLVASQLSGDFILPKDKNKKLIFIAGGIGITPFRSMIKYLIDKKERRTITVFYSNKTVADVSYAKDFDQAEKELGIKTVYSLTDKGSGPPGWLGETGFVDMKMITKYVPNFEDRYFYISGPHAMVVVFTKMLKEMGVKDKQIIKDFFPGFV